MHVFKCSRNSLPNGFSVVTTHRGSVIPLREVLVPKREVQSPAFFPTQLHRLGSNCQQLASVRVSKFARTALHSHKANIVSLIVMNRLPPKPPAAETHSAYKLPFFAWSSRYSEARHDSAMM